VPDISRIFDEIYKIFAAVPTINISHAGMHTILLLVVVSFLFAGILKHFGIRFFDALICSAIGIAAHCFEDLLVFNPAYAFLWPCTSKIVSGGILKGHLNFFEIANSTVLLRRIILFCGALLLRTWIEGTGWWRVFILGGRGRIC
jgi:hypothetical protein